jgi:soluble lytic murein transglycosylase-like protein
VGASTSWRTLAEMDLVYARSRRRATARRAEPPRRSGFDWRIVWAASLAILLLGLIAESTRLEIAPAKSAIPAKAALTDTSCGIPKSFAPAFRKASRESGLPLSLLTAVAWEESRMDPNAHSAAGARGILQLMPVTAKALETGKTNPSANILAGARYLRQLIARFGGNVELALAAYNAGPSAVEHAGAAPTLGALRYAKNIEARAASLAGCG